MTARPPIQYQVRFPSPHTHYAELEARIPLDGRREVELFLPVWTPGSYMVREYARHLESFSAEDHNGTALSVRKTRKNRWALHSDNPIDEIRIAYRLYCHDLSVRTNFLVDDFALLIGAASFFGIVNELDRHYEVRLEVPEGWQGCWSGLPCPEGVFLADDYDTLVDCPLVAGSPAVHHFEIAGVKHELLTFGDSSLWDMGQAAADVEQIAREQLAMWGTDPPYPNYVFFNLLTGGGGGLEHHNSMVIMSDRLAPRTRDGYLGWLDLVSHEFFHVWNVKRLRPEELGPFDYENEVYTRSLWIAEGFTEYYGLLSVRRAGLSSDEEFLGTNRPAKEPTAGSLSGLIERLQTTPGRLQQPVAQASFDAWIKLYRPDENSVNSAISYYVKGAVIGWLLDARIRVASGDTQSLDHVMRIAYQRLRAAGFSEESFRLLAEEVAGVNLSEWFQRNVHTTAELDYQEALSWFGLRFKPLATAGSPSKAWTGVVTRTDAGRLVVTQVPRGTPASNAGISADDEIVGIDGYRVRPDQWERRMEQYRPGEEVVVLVARRDKLLPVAVRLEQEPARTWLLEIDPNASPEQRQHFAGWVRTRREC